MSAGQIEIKLVVTLRVSTIRFFEPNLTLTNEGASYTLPLVSDVFTENESYASIPAAISFLTTNLP